LRGELRFLNRDAYIQQIYLFYNFIIRHEQQVSNCRIAILSRDVKLAFSLTVVLVAVIPMVATAYAPAMHYKGMIKSFNIQIEI
jgi:hypothetical protein